MRTRSALVALRRGVYRSQMTASRLKREGYGTRWHVEPFFSGLKRMMGSTLASRTNITMINETAFKVLACAIQRQALNPPLKWFQLNHCLL